MWKAPQHRPPPQTEQRPVAQSTKRGEVPAAPISRRFAFEIGVDIARVSGSGPGGRISIDDIKKYAKQLNTNRNRSTGVAAKPLPDFSKFGPVQTEKMSRIREITADHMTHCWTTVPSVTQFDKADITDLENRRQKYKKQVEAKGGKLTVTAILVKVLAAALKEFPEFNAAVDMEQRSVVYKKYFNIGIAVDTPQGLLVPTLKNVDQMNITDISIAVNEMAKKARDRKVASEDLQGGCLTVTNLGGIGGTYFSPIINWPEVAILGISKSEIEPVYINNEFEPRLMMPLSLTYDHRVIDGAAGIRFLRFVVSALEDPFILALNG